MTVMLFFHVEKPSVVFFCFLFMDRIRISAKLSNRNWGRKMNVERSEHNSVIKKMGRKFKGVLNCQPCI